MAGSDGGGSRDIHGETADRTDRAGVQAAVPHGGAARHAQAGDAGHPRDGRRALPEPQGARPAGRGGGRRGQGDRGRQAAAGPGARGDGDGAATLRPRRPRRELRHRRRRRPHLLHHGRVRRRDRRLPDAGAPPVDEGGPGGRHAAPGRALQHLVLVADAQRRRLRRDGAAPRARRRLEQHGQAPAGHGQRRARGPLRRGDGHGDRRQRRGAAPPAGAQRPHRHDLAAGRRQGRDRGGARVRRRRRAGHAG